MNNRERIALDKYVTGANHPYVTGEDEGEEMGYLETAKREISRAESTQNPEMKQQRATLAITYTLIALVERLDKLTITEDATRGYLRVDHDPVG